MPSGLVVQDGAFEFVVGETRIGARRFLDADRERLEGFAARYGAILSGDADEAALADLGREVYRWLDGDAGQLEAFLEQVERPCVFEVRGPRAPSPAEWALLRAPFELLAGEGGFLAHDALLRFSVLRRLGHPLAPTPLDDYRLGLAFMASAPRGHDELDFEAEETAILRAAGEHNLDLLVEESGDPRQLRERLAAAGGMPVVHLSCHGVYRWRPADQQATAPRPALLLEDDVGDPDPTDAGALVPLLSPQRPRLLFLSACLSATAPDVGASSPTPFSHSFATALVEAGLPAVLAWDGSVLDDAATKFAATFYESLAQREDVAVAAGDATRALARDEDVQLRKEWHRARLWVGPSSGGPVVGGTRERSLVPATHGHKQFLDTERQQVPVASREMFVGRRRDLQRALRVLRGTEHGAVLLHGQGQMGKSSLAARIANRRPDMALAVVFGRYDAVSVLEAIAEAVKAQREARELLAARIDEVREDPARLGGALLDIVTGPCRQADGEGPPLLLVIDDLERILEPEHAEGPPYLVRPRYAPVLAGALAAFDPATTQSRVVITSRFPFRLEGLERDLHAIQLSSFSHAERTKLQRRQVQAAAQDRRLVDFDRRLELAEQVAGLSRGNPGLQDLIGARLVLSPAVPLDRVEATLEQMHDWLDGGDLPSEEHVRAYLEYLALDALLKQAGEASRDLLRACTIFDMPVPAGIVELLATEVGGSVGALRGLGLLDAFEDVVDHRVEALAVNGLVAGRLESLGGEERITLATLLTLALFDTWGGVAGHQRRPHIADLQLTRLGLLADDPTVVATCAADALALLADGTAATASATGHAAIALLDRQEVEPPPWLLLRTMDATVTAGDGERADALLARIATSLEGQEGEGTENAFQAGSLMLRLARRLQTIGELDRAHDLFARAATSFEAAGAERDVAIARGGLADVHFARGDLDEALRIRTDEQLPVYERLGDIRERAVTMGKIADVHHARGDLDEALRIHTEQLPVYERLGDIRSRAVTMGRIADIHFARGDLDEALRIRTDEELPVYERLGDIRSRAVTMGQIADIHVTREEWDQAATALEEQVQALRELGRRRDLAVALFNLAQVYLRGGNAEAAIPLLAEALSLAEEAEHTEGIAVIGHLYGRLLVQAGVREAALVALRKSYEAYQALGRDDEAGQVMELIEAVGGGEEEDTP